ncbi:MAG TPA: DUF4386 domain-containing protein [Thermoanaerobaculia bacterium]|nr:DUF4386 domain-containing protein [Thermoanaerobaculia bacterium]
MNDRDFRPQVFARLAGFLYLIIIVGGVFAELFVRQRLIVANDPAATGRNILAHEQLFRLGFAAQLVPLLCNMFLAVLLYRLFVIVNRHLALSVVFFSLVGSAVEAASLLAHYAPLVFLKRGAEAGAYMALSLQAVGFSIALTFFGCTCVVRGWLIYRSRFMPRIIGALLSFQGVCYLANSFANFLAPGVARRLFSLLLVSAVGEILLCLWLLIRGVNVERWNEQALRHAG